MAYKKNRHYIIFRCKRLKQYREDEMKRKNTAEIFQGNDEADDISLFDDVITDRTLILKADPPSRKSQLIAGGAKEIRCAICNIVKPLFNAEESLDGWICGECSQKMKFIKTKIK